MKIMHYRTLADEKIKAKGKEKEFLWTIPKGTVFEMPADWVADGNSQPIEIEWLRARRGFLAAPVASRKELKRQLRVELRLLRTDDTFGYDPGDLDDIRRAVIVMHRAGEFEDEEFGEFLEELELAEGRLRAGYRRRA